MNYNLYFVQKCKLWEFNFPSYNSHIRWISNDCTTKYELNLMYLKKDKIGGFDVSNYKSQFGVYSIKRR